MTKIEALKQTIENVESGKFRHNWGNYCSCHCGVVARTLMNGEFPELREFDKIPVQALNEYHDLFSDRAHCMVTGIEIPEVFRVLKEAGFTPTDLRELEYLGNPRIAGLAGLEVGWDADLNAFVSEEYEERKYLLRYLSAWVEILEGEQPQYPDITKSLAILPTEEVADKKLQTVKG